MSNDINSGIYKIINAVNGKIYIGSAVDLARRERQHFVSLNNGKHFNWHLQSAFNKYGAKYFSFEIIEYCEPEDCVVREQYYIDLYTPMKAEIGYNRAPKAGSMLGFKFSEESIKRLSESHKGKKQSKELIEKRIKSLRGVKRDRSIVEKINLKNRGQKRSDETRRIISLNNIGRKLSEDHKNAIAKGRDRFNENHPGRRKVDQYTKDGIFIRTHESLKMAASHLCVKPSNVSRHLNGGRTNIKGFILKYATNE